MRHFHLGANGKELMGRSLFEVMGINVTHIRPCNRQCINTVSYHVSRSLSLGKHGDLDTY